MPEIAELPGNVHRHRTRSVPLKMLLPRLQRRDQRPTQVGTGSVPLGRRPCGRLVFQFEKESCSSPRPRRHRLRKFWLLSVIECWLTTGLWEFLKSCYGTVELHGPANKRRRSVAPSEEWASYRRDTSRLQKCLLLGTTWFNQRTIVESGDIELSGKGPKFSYGSIAMSGSLDNETFGRGNKSFIMGLKEFLWPPKKKIRSQPQGRLLVVKTLLRYRLGLCWGWTYQLESLLGIWKWNSGRVHLKFHYGFREGSKAATQKKKKQLKE